MTLSELMTLTSHLSVLATDLTQPLWLSVLIERVHTAFLTHSLKIKRKNQLKSLNYYPDSTMTLIHYKTLVA